MASVRTRLLLTLYYSWSFGFPLRVGEWYLRTYTHTSPEGKLRAASEIASEMVALQASGFVQITNEFVAPLPESSGLNLQKIRKNRLAVSNEKYTEITPLIKFCSRLPWVRGVAVTGSVAVENAESNDDVDLMIVCAANRLWLVRPLLIFFSQLYGKRRTWRGEEGNSWCFNLWLETNSLSVPATQRSLYTGYEVCQARWIVSKDGCASEFFTANRWVEGIVPFFFKYAQSRAAGVDRRHSNFSFPPIAILLDLANLISFSFQHLYMLPHMTQERVSLRSAAFHPRDTRGNILKSMRSLVLKKNSSR